jgi:hypothetical protein
MLITAVLFALQLTTAPAQTGHSTVTLPIAEAAVRTEEPIQYPVVAADQTRPDPRTTPMLEQLDKLGVRARMAPMDGGFCAFVCVNNPGGWCEYTPNDPGSCCTMVPYGCRDCTGCPD